MYVKRFDAYREPEENTTYFREQRSALLVLCIWFVSVLRLNWCFWPDIACTFVSVRPLTIQSAHLKDDSKILD